MKYSIKVNEVRAKSRDQNAAINILNEGLRLLTEVA